MLESSSLASDGLAGGLGRPPLSASAAALRIVANDPASATAAENAALLAGADIVGRSDFAQTDAPLDPLLRFDVLLIEATGAEPAALEALLLWAQSASQTAEAGLVVCCDTEQLDQVVSQVTAPGAQLLCDPTTADRVAALTIARQRRLPQFGGFTENEGDRLRRLSEEVARIADALNRLTVSGRAGKPEGRARFDPAPVTRDGIHLEPGPIPTDQGAEALPTPSAIRGVIRARRLREQFFDAELFADPAWDMLLDLTVARLEQASVSVSSLCIAAAVPPTTALRWITTMIEAGLFERQDDPHDRRRAYVALTDRGFEGMQGYVAAVRRMGLPLF
ncbi:winged helix DNA-binding protein [Sphingomonas sp. PL-96]|uniref:winged helix DNA-binding protein n=1 Tax=Sphingomonas sp. PL-96 TaxID=2887201 RepID=UPI001E45E5FD|nr:winged helix DNA-binding protein [Sphingomonas sp. PL-96]MCC2977256.1 winged helix DNA-binding protein [Sphingomonas sp. PL-96]